MDIRCQKDRFLYMENEMSYLILLNIDNINKKMKKTSL